MQRLVDYESSDESEDDLHTIKLAQQGEFEVSMRAEEGVPLDPTHDSYEILLAKPQKNGCSREQAVEASIEPKQDTDEILGAKPQQIECLCPHEQAAEAPIGPHEILLAIQQIGCSHEQAAQAAQAPIGPACDLDDFLLAKLIDFGCSHEQAAQAISVCGRDAPISELFDYIQAWNCNVGDEGCAPKFLDSEEDTEIRLTDMGYTHVYILNALKACGKQSTITEVVDFIQAHYCIEDASCSENKVAERELVGLNHESDESPSKRLQEMGCTSEDIAKAISVCGENAHVSDLFDFIQASQYPIDDEGYAFDAPVFEKDVSLTTQGLITDALTACGKQSSNLDIADFIQTHYCNGDERKRSRGNPLTFAARERKHSSGSPLTFVAREDGPSESMAKRAKWTRTQTKIWSSFVMQKKKAIGSSDSEENDNDFLESTWEAPEEEKMVNFNPYSSALQHERMMGFGIPGHLNGRPRLLPECMQGPPFFYFENVANVVGNAWNTIKLHFNGVEPEFVDSRFFSATRRLRGYVHNLPVKNRKLILPSPPMTIFEALPRTRQHWPYWDTRDKVNCITTQGHMLKDCDSIRDILSNYESMDIPDEVQREILQVCKKYNLVWVGPNQLASLEVSEIEFLLGFDIDHTRGCLSMTDRYKLLGNSFQINTVAYHLSPLKSLYPKGITVLSLFTGIGGAEVALDKIGIFLKRVVVVEKVDKARDIFVNWWKKTRQKGELNCKYHDVKEITYEVLTELIEEVGKIDLVIGGSPCNNLSGNNRWNRNGLNGTESSLFFEFPRILNNVRIIMEKKGIL